MKHFFLLAFSLLLFCTTAQGLVCSVCKFQLGHLCLRTGDPCRAEQGQFCEMTKVYSAGLLLYKRYGCGEHHELCNREEHRDTAFGRTYERTCCNTDLCNK
ncbi:lymphocyte antigen 6 complex locus protein G6c [Candoia aspera]|uniref:lymphocyte antigen 6 complex locus protein G6c n=1 Tax=Candoia aspera TaxID=51853 RepID=UPI002FD7D548